MLNINLLTKPTCAHVSKNIREYWARRCIILGAALVSIAQSSSEMAIAFPAILSAADPNSQINIRKFPAISAHSPHYGLAGDKIDVMRSIIADDGYEWSFIRFYVSGASGWVRNAYVKRQPTITTRSQNKPIATEIQNDYKFEVISCLNTVDNLLCRFRITNLGQVDRVLRLDGRSRFVTYMGHEALDNCKKGLEHMTCDRCVCFIPKASVAKNKPVMAFVSFNPLSTKTNKVALLELAYISVSADNFSQENGPVRFRDLDIK